MKIWIVLLSLLAAAAVWYAGGRRRTRDAGLRPHVRLALRSIAAGVAVYFCLMSIALVYLMLTTA
jgi:hypothetical protein